jgi:predicted O-methyltransferase YrrM
VLQEIERQGAQRFLPIVGPAKGQILDEVVRTTKPTRVLEVGTLVGYSAIRMARLLPAQGHIISVEIDRARAREAQRNVARAGLAVKVQIRVGDAKRILPQLAGPFDLVFLDATKEEYLTYLRLVEPQLHPGSVVVADNAGVFADRLADYLEYVRHSGKYRSTYREATLEFHEEVRDGVEVSVRL